MTRSASGRCSRRRFLVTAAAGGALALPVPVAAAAAGRGAAVAPGERIGLGLIGICAMGRGHLALSLRNRDVEVLAVCDVDRWRRDQAKASVENAYRDAPGRAAYRGCDVYTDLRELLDRDDIDAVFIATGDRWHVPAGVLAAKAGKDVYCEKPLSLTLGEARAMITVARRYGCVFQVGQQQRSTPEFITACALVRDGVLGRVTHVYVCFPGTSADVNLPPEPTPESVDWDLWLGPAPWRPFSGQFHHVGQPRHVVPWHFCRDFGGGNLTSNAVHAFDIVQWGLGMDSSGPVRICPPETGKVPSLTYTYAGGTLLQVDWQLDPARHFVPKGWNPATRIENFGALFVGEKGWIHVGREGYLRSYPEEIVAGGVDASGERSPVVRHHNDWLQAIRTRTRPACDVEMGARAAMVAHLGCIAHWTARELVWDPVREEFAGDDAANRMRVRPMREPWRL